MIHSCTTCLVLLILLLFIKSSNSESQNDGIYVGTLSDFSNKQNISLHFYCPESNFFTTNCACHIKCTKKDCQNAIDLCQKYRKTHLCKYVLLRNGNKLATLKREITSLEQNHFSIDEFRYMKLDYTLPLPKQTFRDMAISNTEIMDTISKINSQIRKPKSNFCFTNTSFTSKTTESKKMKKSFIDENFLNDGISIVVISYKSPLSLTNSIRSWNSSGLLGLAKERLMILSDPDQTELNVARSFGFEIIQPKDIPNGKMVKPNVMTIGAAFYYSLLYAKSEYVLVLENDFKIDLKLSRKTIMKELIAGSALLKGGAEVVRYQSRKTKGCGTFKDCNHQGINLRASQPSDRLKNWFSFYCRGFPGTDSLVSDCLRDPDFRCFRSFDTNWSLNAALVKKSSMLHTKYYNKRTKAILSIGEIGLAQWSHQDGFEYDMALGGNMWSQWDINVCISYNGMFIHEEIETSQ